jgi:hypothetical protein
MDKLCQEVPMPDLSQFIKASGTNQARRSTGTMDENAIPRSPPEIPPPAAVLVTTSEMHSKLLCDPSEPGQTSRKC